MLHEGFFMKTKISTSALLFLALACGPSTPVQRSTTPPSNPQFASNQQGSAFGGTTVLSAILGQYTGTVYKEKDTKFELSQSYHFSMSQASGTSDVGVLDFNTDGPIGTAQLSAALRTGVNGSLLGVDTDGQPIYLYTFFSSKVTAEALSSSSFTFQIDLALKQGQTLVQRYSKVKIWECALASSSTCTYSSLDITFGSDLRKL
jgi:hypothetical protein